MKNLLVFLLFCSHVFSVEASEYIFYKKSENIGVIVSNSDGSTSTSLLSKRELKTILLSNQEARNKFGQQFDINAYLFANTLKPSKQSAFLEDIEGYKAAKILNDNIITLNRNLSIKQKCNAIEPDNRELTVIHDNQPKDCFLLTNASGKISCNGETFFETFLPKEVCCNDKANENKILCTNGKIYQKQTNGN